MSNRSPYICMCVRGAVTEVFNPVTVVGLGLVDGCFDDSTYFLSLRVCEVKLCQRRSAGSSNTSPRALTRSWATAADVSQFEFHFPLNIKQRRLDQHIQRLPAGVRPSQCDSVRGAFLFHVRSCGSGAFIGCAIRGGGPLRLRLGVSNRRSRFGNFCTRDDHICLLSRVLRSRTGAGLH